MRRHRWRNPWEPTDVYALRTMAAPAVHHQLQQGQSGPQRGQDGRSMCSQGFGDG